MTEELKLRIKNFAENGIVSSKKITELGFHRSVLSELVKSGDLVQCYRGIYMFPDEWEDEYYLLQQKYKKGIFSYSSALYLLGYSERVPFSFHMTFPTNYNAQSLLNENITIIRVKPENYKLGVTTVQTQVGNTVRVFDLERSLCDILRGNGDDLQIIQYAMKKYANSKERDINKLMKYAKLLHVESKVRKYIEVLL